MALFINLRFILIAALGLCGLSACGLPSQVKVTTVGGVCSSDSIESGCAAESSKVLSLTSRRPLVIKSGDTVALTGTGFNKAMSATVGGIAVTSLKVTSATSASLVVPAGVATGMSNLKLALTAAEATASVAYMPSSEMQLFTGSVSEICAGVEFYDIIGDKQTGTKSCSGSSSTPDCTANGSVGCVTTTSYKSADFTNLLAGNIKSGVTIAGVTGSVTESPANCGVNGQQSCVASGSYFAGTACGVDGSSCYLPLYASGTQNKKAIDYSSIDAANIRTGVTIAGVAGQYPSATYTLTGATVTADLDSATFDAKMKSATEFEWFGPSGVRYTGAGDADLSTAANIANDVTIFGTTGTLVSSSPPSAWDIRAGVTASGIVGKLKVNCRNAATLATFDIDVGQSASVSIGSPGVFNITAHGLANGTAVRLNYTTAPGGVDNSLTYYVVNSSTNSFQLSATSGGAGINVTSSAGANVTVHRWKAAPAVVDIWDTIDDYYGLPGSAGFPQAWSVANNYCGGVETVSGDDNVWKDVTTAGTGGASCAGSPERCTMQDKISGLNWSKSYQVSGSQSSMSWWAAVTYCNASTDNGQLAGSWRLPTQKELLNAYEHGIISAASNDWMTLSNMNSYFWSASSYSNLTFLAWVVNLGYGYTTYINKNSNYAVVCVR